jgi:hypothetical protein
VSTGVAIDWVALKIEMSAWVHDRGEVRTVCYGVVKYVFFGGKTGCDSSRANRQRSRSSTVGGELGLAPVVAGLSLVGEHLVEGFGLLDEDVPLLVRLMQQHGL